MTTTPHATSRSRRDLDATLARIRKLLTLAEDPAATLAEAAASNAKAAERIARYGIDRAARVDRPGHRPAGRPAHRAGPAL